MSRNASYMDKKLPVGENIQFKAKRHWKRYLLPTIGMYGSIVLAIMAAIYTINTYGKRPLEGGMGIIMMSAFIALGCFSWKIFLVYYDRFDEMVVTDDHLICKKGIMKTEVSSLSLGFVEYINVEQDLLSRIIGCGNITIASNGGKTFAVYKDVDKPEEFRNTVMQMAKQRRFQISSKS